MNWNTIPNDERFYLWRQLRDSIQDLPVKSQIEKIAKFSFSMPLGARSLDYYTPSSWPTPWEILFYGSFCRSSISLLMYYTLVLVNDSSNIELHLIDDDGEVYLLPVIDNRFICNYYLGAVNDYSELSGVKVLKIYKNNDIKSII